MTRRFFGTDGVRGVYGGPVINEVFAAQLGFAAAKWLRKRGAFNLNSDRVPIGRDTRFSGASLEVAVACGLRAGGVEPVSLGVLPTPAVARAVAKWQAPLGVVITASHNPAEDNGIKFFGFGGRKLSDDAEAEIESLLDAPVPERHGGESLAASDGAVADYVAAAQALLPPRSLAGWRIVLDTANGATCGTSPAVFRALGAEVIPLGDAPDGRNINRGVGSEHPEQMAARVRSSGARLGVAHDGDGDRCVLCDERGEIADGDEILTILATHAARCGTLVKKTLVITVQSNLGVDAALAAAGGRVCRTAVGDRYVVERMLAEGATLGGESSGHVICGEISPTGDGLVAALKIIEVMVATGLPLSQLRHALRKFPQQTLALRVREKKPIEALPVLVDTIRRLEAELGSLGRVLVRYSGTEAKIRLLVEGPTDATVSEGLRRLEVATRNSLEIV